MEDHGPASMRPLPLDPDGHSTTENPLVHRNGDPESSFAETHRLPAALCPEVPLGDGIELQDNAWGGGTIDISEILHLEAPPNGDSEIESRDGLRPPQMPPSSAPSMPLSTESISLYRQPSPVSGPEEEDYKTKILEDMAYRLATAPSDSIQRRKKAILNELRETKLRAENIFQSDQPLAMFLTAGRKPAVLITICLIIFLVEFTFSVLTASQLRATAEYRHFRFVPLELRNGSTPQHPGISDFHMLSNGCMVNEGFINITFEGPFIVKTYAEKVVANGFVVIMRDPPDVSLDCNDYRQGARPGPRPPLGEGEPPPDRPPPPGAPGRGDGGGFARPQRIAKELEPVAFRVEGSESGEEWHRVASTTWAYNAWLEPVCMDGALAEAQLGNLLEFDLRPPLGLVFFRTALPAFKFVMLALALVLVMRGKAVLAAAVLVLSFLFDALICGVSAVGLLYTAPAALTFMPWVGFAFSLTAWLMLTFRQRTAMVSIALLASSLPVAVFVDTTVVSKTRTFWTDVPYVAVLMVLVGLRWLGYYRSLLNMATQNIESDKARYNQEWERFVGEVRASSEERQALVGVNRLLREMRDFVSGSERPLHRVYVEIARQTPQHPDASHAVPLGGVLGFERSPSNDRVEPGPASLRPVHRGSSWKERTGSFVRSFSRHSLAGRRVSSEEWLGRHYEEVADLDQVYNQARGVQPFFRDKVWDLAKATNALLPVREEGALGDALMVDSSGSAIQRSLPGREGGEGGGEDSVDGGEGGWGWVGMQMRRMGREGGGGERPRRQYVEAEAIGEKSLVEWTALKPVDRAIHKVRRVYGDRASRVVDVVRERIGFQSLSQLQDCVWSILEDEDEIEVRGVKNGLRDNYNPDWSAGFRAVTLSLSIQTKETRELALAQHVCELQLVLLPMLKIEADCNHRAYIIFRDTRSLKAASPFSSLYYTRGGAANAAPQGMASIWQSAEVRSEDGVRQRMASQMSGPVGISRLTSMRRVSMMSTLSCHSPTRPSPAAADFLRLRRLASSGSARRRWLQGDKIELTRMDTNEEFSRSLLIKADDQGREPQPDGDAGNEGGRGVGDAGGSGGGYSEELLTLSASQRDLTSPSHAAHRALSAGSLRSLRGSFRGAGGSFRGGGGGSRLSMHSVAMMASFRQADPAGANGDGVSLVANGEEHEGGTEHEHEREEEEEEDVEWGRANSLPPEPERTPDGAPVLAAGNSDALRPPRSRKPSSLLRAHFSAPSLDVSSLPTRLPSSSRRRSSGVSAVSPSAQHSAIASLPAHVDATALPPPHPDTPQPPAARLERASPAREIATFASLPAHIPARRRSSARPAGDAAAAAAKGLAPHPTAEVSSLPSRPKRRSILRPDSRPGSTEPAPAMASDQTSPFARLRRNTRRSLASARGSLASNKGSTTSTASPDPRTLDSLGSNGSHEVPTPLAPTPGGQSTHRNSKGGPLRTPLSRRRRKSSIISLEVPSMGGFFRRRRKGIAQPEGGEEETLQGALTKLFLEAVKNPGGRLDRKMRGGGDPGREPDLAPRIAAIRGASLISAFFTSSPITYTVGLNRIKAFLVAIAVLYFFGAGQPAQMLLQQGMEDIRGIRFEALTGVDGEATAGTLDLRRVGLLRDGCEAVHFLNGNCSLNGTVFEQHWDPPVRANGWFILLEPPAAGERASRQVSGFRAWWNEEEEGGSEWECLVKEDGDDEEECGGQLGGEGGLEGAVVMRQNRTHVEYKFDERPQLHAKAWAVAPLLKGFGFLAAAVCGAVRTEAYAVWWLAGSRWVLAAAMVVAAALLGPSGAVGSQWPWWVCLAVAEGVCGTGLLLVQRHAVLLQGVEAGVSVALLLGVFLRRELAGAQVAGALGDGVVLVACAGMAWMRWRVLVTSERMIQQDWERYDAEWALLLAADPDLETLSATVDRFPRSSGEAPRQRVVLALPASAPAPASQRSPAGLLPPCGRLSPPIREWSRRGRSADPSPERGPRSEAQNVAGESAGSVGGGARGAGMASSDGGSREGSRDGGVGVVSLALSRVWSGRVRGGGEGPGSGGAGGRELSGAGRAAARESLATLQTLVEKRFSDEWMGMGPVRSLDQIFAQARALHAILRDKVKDWALKSNGMVRRKSGGYRRWDPADADDAVWASVKRAERAIEKVLRSYGGDPSRLVDVCRQALVFETVADLRACLTCVQTDPDVRVLRLKNRLDKNYDSALSAGYRDIAMNLIVCTEETQKLAVDAHVCEFQLILKGFAELKSNEGHKRYVEFRNKRGE